MKAMAADDESELSGRIETRVEGSGRILRVSYHGIIDAARMRDHFEKLATLSSELETGFVLATDLSEVELIRSECLPMLRDVMAILREAGVRIVVRLIPRPECDIGFTILSRFHYPSDLHCVTCETREDWERWLEDEWATV